MNLDLLRAVMQGGGDGADGDRPAAAGGYLADVARQRPAGDDLNLPACPTWRPTVPARLT
ncbi:MAG TPA: hypothetical protein VF838_12275 [Trebonia sp.]